MANKSESQYKKTIITHYVDTGLYGVGMVGVDKTFLFTLDELKSFEFHLSTFLEDMARQEDEDNCQHQCTSNCRREGCVCIDNGHQHG